MKNNSITNFLGVILTSGLLITKGYADDRGPARVGFQFLTVVTDARAAAMGEAFTTVDGKSSSIFYNPANLVRMGPRFALSISRNNWIADITYHSASAAFKPNFKEGILSKLQVFALSFLYIDYGEFLGTEIDATTEKGYIDTHTFSPTAYALGIGYAHGFNLANNKKLSVGGHVKYVSQSFGSGNMNATENSVNVLAFDLGVSSELSLSDLRCVIVGAKVSNISKAVRIEPEKCEELPLNYTVGVSFCPLVYGDKNYVLISQDYTYHPNFSDQSHSGIEFTYDKLSLRVGYKYNINETIKTGQNDEKGVTAGIGLQSDIGKSKIDIDYAYTPFGVFDDVQRISVRFSF